MRLTRSLVLLLILAGSSQTALADASMDRVLKEARTGRTRPSSLQFARTGCSSKGSHLKGVDRVTTTLQKPAIFKDNVVIAEGGAVRAKNHWYFLDFTCAVSADQMKRPHSITSSVAKYPRTNGKIGLWK